MKIRTKEQLIDQISAEISWRRKELTDLKYVLETATARTRQDVLTRAAVALLYAHWEGFVKAAGELYLEFVAMQRCKNSELADNMLAIILRTKLHNAESSTKIAPHVAIVNFLRTQMGERSALPYKGAVRTDANLSSAVLLEMLHTLGLATIDYVSKFHMIDNQLLAKRNHIAHGKALDVDVADYLQLHEDILSLMNLLRNQLENAAVTGQYLQPIGAGP